MAQDTPALFPPLFGQTPNLVREFLYSALQIRDLQELYKEARAQKATCLSQAVLQLLDIKVKISARDMERVPRTGPLVVAANHPCGILDGLILDSVLLQIRPDFRILMNSLLCGTEEFRERSFPVDVFGGKSAAGSNASSLRRALRWLEEGHVLACFPAGEVSHWERTKGRTDGAWSEAPFGFALRTKAAVMPVYLGGANSLSFEVAGLLHPRLRTARLPGELLNKKGRDIEVRVGRPMSNAELQRLGGPQIVTAVARARTYLLKQRKAEVPMRRPALHLLPLFRTKQQCIASGTEGSEMEIERLTLRGGWLAENDTFGVAAAQGREIPALLEEIGRLRELTFRAVGEGTGRSRDLDGFDQHYLQLILWNKAAKSVAGGYRLAWTEDVLPSAGESGLYTSTLFRFQPEFFERLGPAVELGRSFIRAEYQKDYAPLLLLWQAIGTLLARRPEAPVLFGSVSISSEYSDWARELMVQFISNNRSDHESARFVAPRKPFRPRLMKRAELEVLGRVMSDIDDLSHSISEFENDPGVPVLLRHYLKLGGRVAGFHVDRGFGHCLDGLLILDLRDSAPRLLSRYLGHKSAAELLKNARRREPEGKEVKGARPVAC